MKKYRRKNQTNNMKRHIFFIINVIGLIYGFIFINVPLNDYILGIKKIIFLCLSVLIGFFTLPGVLIIILLNIKFPIQYLNISESIFCILIAIIVDWLINFFFIKAKKNYFDFIIDKIIPIFIIIYFIWIYSNYYKLNFEKYIADCNFPKMELAIKNGANINKTYSGKVPIIEFDNNLKGIKFFLKNGANINMIDSTGATILHHLFILDHSDEIIKFILNNKIDVNIEDCHKETALYNLISSRLKNKMEILELFFDKGININTKNLLGNTPLILAVIKNNLAIVKKLLENGADYKIKNNKGKTALMIAQEKDYIEIVKILTVVKH